MIYLLHENPVCNAKMLDDKTLSRQIREIARVLCAVHHCVVERIDLGIEEGKVYEIPLPYKKYKSCEARTQYMQWAYACLANYNKLIEMGLACCEEYDYRFCKKPDEYDYAPGLHRMTKVIVWARDNCPSLPGKHIHNPILCEFDPACSRSKKIGTPFPIVMPRQYIELFPTHEKQIIKSYRNYYRAKLFKKDKYAPLIRLLNGGDYKPVDCFFDFTRRECPEFLKEVE